MADKEKEKKLYLGVICLVFSQASLATVIAFLNPFTQKRDPFSKTTALNALYAGTSESNCVIY